MSVELQLYLWSGSRAAIIEKHCFYAEQVRERIIAQFRDIEGEAKAFADSAYDRLGSMGDENSDISAIAEAAQDQGIERYRLLHDLKKQVMLAATAAMYHQWDKELRDFVEGELQHYLRTKDVQKIAWNPNIGNVFDVLRDFGWDCRAEPFFPVIDACRLLVNVYKHGKGRSLEELAQKYPAYLDRPFKGLAWPGGDWLDHEWLQISDAQFGDIATAIETFWRKFPERLFLIQ